jgi:phage replication-related protein YjqB (UPF0714/DUF867 family)
LSKYGCFAELARNETLGRDYRVRTQQPPNSDVLIIAPHGGLIEVGTSEIAELIAGGEFCLFSFEGLKPHGANRDLHITSHRFDHPECLAMVSLAEVVLGVHGCLGDTRIHIGGLDAQLCQALADALDGAGFPVVPASERYPGRHPLNICNRGARGKGAQLEVTYDLRRSKEARASIAQAARRALRASRYILRGGSSYESETP